MADRKKTKTKTKAKRKVSSGVAHVVSSFNNTIITISDETT
jgi:ribosomal protein S11